MAVGKKLFGRATIKVNGVVLGNFTGATLDPGMVKRTTQNGSNTVLGYTEEVMNSKVEVDVRLGQGDTLKQYDVVDAVVEFSTDTGQNYVIPNAWRTDSLSVAEGGKVKLVLEGLPAEEVA